MDFKTLIRDKRFQIAAAVVVVVGLVALARKSSAAKSTATDGKTSSTVGGTTEYVSSAPGNTMGTDVASWMGDYSQSLQNQLDAYQQTFGEQITAIKDSATAVPAYAAGQNEANWLVETKPWWDWDQWLTRAKELNPTLSTEDIKAANPGMASNVDTENRFKQAAMYLVPKTKKS